MGLGGKIGMLLVPSLSDLDYIVHEFTNDSGRSEDFTRGRGRWVQGRGQVINRKDSLP